MSLGISCSAALCVWRFVPDIYKRREVHSLITAWPEHMQTSQNIYQYTIQQQHI